ncbi:hypothetical protein [Aquipuribacter nitratireducens]|uniref:DUF4440 domain-containing protein n=1 Tax=Aquipuribacter nitratireducens TaxID=650104 RepID=A0ABW0GNU6_9MICO
MTIRRTPDGRDAPRPGSWGRAGREEAALETTLVPGDPAGTGPGERRRLPVAVLAVLAGVVGLVVGSVLASPGVATPETSDPERAAVAALLREWHEAVREGDVDGVRRLAAPDAQVFGGSVGDASTQLQVESWRGSFDSGAQVGRPVVAIVDGSTYLVAQHAQWPGSEDLLVFWVVAGEDGLRVARLGDVTGLDR